MTPRKLCIKKQVQSLLAILALSCGWALSSNAANQDSSIANAAPAPVKTEDNDGNVTKQNVTDQNVTNQRVTNASDTQASPFANIESWRYPNGLQVYFQAMPKSELATFRMTIPVGGWQDPENRTGLAHFTEHMLFTGSKGYSKAEFKKLADDRGGQNNASTSVKRTDYWLELPDKEWAFGLEWFGQLLFNHEFSAKHVDEERRAVILERDLKPETPLDILNRWFIRPAWSRQDDEWTKMLGLDIPHQSLIGTWNDVNAINVEDIQSFYDRYYGPQNMTIMLAGNFPRDQVKAYIDQNFGNIKMHGELIQSYKAAKPQYAKRRHFNFTERRGHVHELRHYISDIDREDVQWLWFLRVLLHHDLNTELRQNRQAAYGVNVTFNLIQGHGRLITNGNFDPLQEQEALSYIEEMYEQLSTNTVSPEQFEVLRKKVLDAIILDHQTPWNISDWVVSIFYDKNLTGGHIPDLYQFAKHAKASELAQWMKGNLREDLSIKKSVRPNPIWPLANTALFIMAVILSFSLGRRFLTKPLDLHQHLYIRKALYGPLSSTMGFILFFCICCFLMHAMSLSADFIQLHYVSTVDSFWLSNIWNISTLALATIVILNIPARIPRKLILARSHWRVKCLSYRSQSYQYQDIKQVQEKYLLQVLFNWKLFPCRLFHWNVFSKGLLIQLDRGSYFVKTRDNQDVIQAFKQRTKPQREQPQPQSKQSSHESLKQAEQAATSSVAPAA